MLKVYTNKSRQYKAAEWSSGMKLFLSIIVSLFVYNEQKVSVEIAKHLAIIVFVWLYLVIRMKITNNWLILSI